MLGRASGMAWRSAAATPLGYGPAAEAALAAAAEARLAASDARIEGGDDARESPRPYASCAAPVKTRLARKPEAYEASIRKAAASRRASRNKCEMANAMAASLERSQSTSSRPHEATTSMLAVSKERVQSSYNRPSRMSSPAHSTQPADVEGTRFGTTVIESPLWPETLRSPMRSLSAAAAAARAGAAAQEEPRPRHNQEGAAASFAALYTDALGVAADLMHADSGATLEPVDSATGAGRGPPPQLEADADAARVAVAASGATAAASHAASGAADHATDARGSLARALAEAEAAADELLVADHHREPLPRPLHDELLHGAPLHKPVQQQHGAVDVQREKLGEEHEIHEAASQRLPVRPPKARQPSTYPVHMQPRILNAHEAGAQQQQQHVETKEAGELVPYATATAADVARRREELVVCLRAQLVERDRTILVLRAQVGSRDQTIAQLEEKIACSERQIFVVPMAMPPSTPTVSHTDADGKLHKTATPRAGVQFDASAANLVGPAPRPAGAAKEPTELASNVGSPASSAVLRSRLAAIKAKWSS